MHRRIFTVAAALMLTVTAFGLPAKRQTKEVRQSDGTTLTVMRRGDENFHFVSTTDGLPLARCTDGTYCYALKNDDGTLRPSSQIAHNVGARQNGELAFLASYAKEADAVCSIGAERAAMRNARRMARLVKRGAVDRSGAPLRQRWAGATGEGMSPITGKHKGLVILVNFKDVKMQDKHGHDEWNDFFNKDGYDYLGNSGSVHDYFYNQSYGQFDLSFDVIGPVTVSKKMSAYGANDASGDDVDPAGMVYEACQLAASQVNFADYDWDGDGEVDQVFVVYAGYGEASDLDGVHEDAIWQHEWDLGSAGYSLKYDGVKINTYACSSELNFDSGTDMDGIGSACHEFSHCLGIPDLYDTGSQNNFGMAYWDLMDMGSYSGDGYCPVGYNTYERWVSGWLEPTELSKPCNVAGLKALSDAPESFVVYNEAKPTEYYILENRQLSGSDTELPAHGLLVLHVDYDRTAWENNSINNMSSHQRFTIVPADNRLTYETEDGDTYPGSTGNTSLTDTSLPSAKLFNANSDGRKFLGKPITNISESDDGLISFTFMNGETVAVPDDLASTNVAATSFTASWSAVADAESYNVEVREKSNASSPEESVMVAEDFSSLGADKTNDGTSDISSKLDSYTVNKGWTGYKVYEGPGRLKIGSSKSAGYITSPLVSSPSSDKVTVKLKSAAYSGDIAESIIYLYDSEGQKIDAVQIAPNGSEAVIVFDNPDMKDFRVSIDPRKRCYIYSVAIYDGEFDEADVKGNMSAKSVASYAVQNRAAAKRFTGINGTEYAVDNLTPGATYQWRAQAVKSAAVSEWTGWQTVTLKTDESGISGTVASQWPDAGTKFVVYTASGACLGTATYDKFLTSDSFPRGVYVLKTTGGAALRIVK